MINKTASTRKARPLQDNAKACKAAAESFTSQLSKPACAPLTTYRVVSAVSEAGRNIRHPFFTSNLYTPSDAFSLAAMYNKKRTGERARRLAS